MILTSWEQWVRWKAEAAGEAYTMLPYIARYPLAPGCDRPASWTAAWQEAKPGSFVLESGKDGRYSFLGLRPVSSIRGKGNEAALADSEGQLVDVWSGKPLDLVKRWLRPYRSPVVPEAPKWTGGCVGFWSYDVVRSLEKLPAQAADDLPLPDYAFYRIDQLWIVDHADNALYCAIHSPAGQETLSEADLRLAYEAAQRDADRMKRQWDEWTGGRAAAAKAHEEKLRSMKEDGLEVDVETIPEVAADFSKERFMAAVRSIQDYIRAGDVFQVNLSVRQHKKLEADPEEIYEWLRRVNPSPYMGLLRCGDFHLVSGSPELLVQLERGKVRTRPIAGTRPRGRTPEEDRQLAEELLNHEKERAEHIMLVDLERNDLGRISAFGSVRVPELMAIEYYSHVMHIVSQVEGELSEGRDAFDVIRACFPGGTITGAPKIRTMEIIEELEPVRRGPYTGSIGWIDYNGDMEFNIVIRTLVAAGGVGYVQAGAGIVIDSVPEKEYTEAINKAKAMWKAIQYSERYAARTRGG